MGTTQGGSRPPTLVPHATAISSAEPKALLPTSSMPMKRSMRRQPASLIRHDGVRQDGAQDGGDKNQARICRRVLVPMPSRDSRAMRRSSPQRRHNVARMFAPSNRKISCSA